MVLSVSNFPSLTHWWNWQSSISTVLALRTLKNIASEISLCLWTLQVFASSFYLVRLTASLSKTNLSLRPNLHSGVPDRYALINIWPATSDRKIVPVLLMSKLTLSITSMNASFFLYLISLRLHDVAPVAWIVILLESSALSDLTPSVVMYIFRVSVSLFCG